MIPIYVKIRKLCTYRSIAHPNHLSKSTWFIYRRDQHYVGSCIEHVGQLLAALIEGQICRFIHKKKGQNYQVMFGKNKVFEGQLPIHEKNPNVRTLVVLQEKVKSAPSRQNLWN